MKIAILLALIVVISCFFLTSCSSFGTMPHGKYVESKYSMKKLDNYDYENKIFVNRKKNLIKQMNKDMKFFDTLIKWFQKGESRAPEKTLPSISFNMEEFKKKSEDIKVSWFGHSSFILNINEKIILVDPVFSEEASPVKYMVKRFQKSPAKLDDLKDVDYILISHDHYDHLDMKVAKFFRDKKAKYITPLGISSHLIGWGVSKDKIIELNWWENIVVDNIEFISTPAQHFSGRGLTDRNKTLWSSWVINSKKHRVFFSGDSGYDSHFKEIGDKYGPFDIAFLESGQYNDAWKEVHMHPEDAVQAFFDLKADKYFPIHWGMFVLSFHRWYEPVERIITESQNRPLNLVTPVLGEIVMINDNLKTTKWWQNLVLGNRPVVASRLNAEKITR